MNMYIALSVFIILNTIMNLNELIVICIARQVILSYIYYDALSGNGAQKPSLLCLGTIDCINNLVTAYIALFTLGHMKLTPYS